MGSPARNQLHKVRIPEPVSLLCRSLFELYCVLTEPLNVSKIKNSEIIDA